MIRIAKFIAVFCLMAAPVLAQRGNSSASSGGDRGSAASSGSASASTSSVSTGRDSTSSVSSSSGRTSTMGGFPGGGGSSYSVPAPRLVGTSFTSYSTYRDFQSFLFYLRSMYWFTLDTNRFMRNYEPLVTPQFAFLAARRSLGLSMQLMATVDELASLLTDAQAGKPVNKKEIEANTRQIRVLAKAIRTDYSLAFVDRRATKDLFKGVNVDQLGTGAIDRLREMVTDLNTQLRNMAQESQTATVSVDYLTRPSFASLSKGIEKLSQVIERSAGRN